MSMPSVFMRRAIDALSPKGAAWRPAPGGKMDGLADGLADGRQATLADLEGLSCLRDPWRVPLELLPDLEREFGITPTTALTETDRRQNLAIIRYHRKATRGSVVRLQSALDRAGFGAGGYGLMVTPNASPATDPAPIVDNAYQLTAHAIGQGMYAGNAGAYAAKRGGYYLVNGDTYQLEPIYPQAGLICARAFGGSDSKSGEECAGHYVSYVEYENKHSTPPSQYWPLIFFVGGAVNRNVSGSIAAVSTVWIPSHRRQELHRLILRIKPLGMWAAMCVQYS